MTKQLARLHDGEQGLAWHEEAWHEEAWQGRRGRPGAAGLRRGTWGSTARAWRVALHKSDCEKCLFLSLFVPRGSDTATLVV